MGAHATPHAAGVRRGAPDGSVPHGSGNLRPSYRTLIGRERALDRLRAWLAEGRRLITLVGPGGVGKTALALSLGEMLVAEASRSVWFFDVTEARRAEDIATIVATALGLPLAGNHGLDETLEHLGRTLGALGPCLLIFDNFEQVVAHADATLGRWCSSGPDVRIVATSRAALGLVDETRLELVPLEVPAAECNDLAELGRSQAAALFLRRVRDLRADWSPRPDDAGSIAQLVRRLDGMPLALELAAARAVMLEPTQLLQRLADRFRLLSRAERDRPSRHATLRAAIDWSWELLSPRERVVLCQTAVFRGGFDLEAAEAVLRLDADDDRDVLERLQDLREKSLLVTETGPLGARFRLLETIRDYAEGRLAERGDAMAVRDRHAAHYAATGIAHEEAWSFGHVLEHRYWLTTERHNLEWAFDHAEARVAASTTDEALEWLLQCALALDRLDEAGPVALRLERQSRALASLDSRPVSLAARRLQARLLAERALALEPARRPDEALALMAQAAEHARLAGEARVEVFAHCFRAYRLGLQGDLAGAATWESVARDIAERSGDDINLYWSRNCQGLLASLRADEAAGLAFNREALVLARRARYEAGEGFATINTGIGLHRFGDAAAAMQHLEAARVCFERRKLLDYTAYAWRSMARIRLDLRDHSGARHDLEQAKDLFRWLGFASDAAHLRGLEACLDLDRGHVESAHEALQQVLTELRDRHPRFSAELAWLFALLTWLTRGAEAARAPLEASVERALLAGGSFREATARGTLGALYACLGEIELAMSSLALARDAAQRMGSAWVIDTAAVFQACADHLASSPGSNARPDATAVLAAMTAPGPAEDDYPWGRPSPAQQRFELRLACHLLSSLLPPAERGHAVARALDPGATWLLVAPDGRRFRPPGGVWVDLAHRSQLVALLGRLLRHRRGRPEPALSQDDVAAALWPGEKILPEALSNRIYKTIAEVRALGLKPVLQSVPEGYRLDPAVPVLTLSQPTDWWPLAGVRRDGEGAAG